LNQEQRLNSQEKKIRVKPMRNAKREIIGSEEEYHRRKISIYIRREPAINSDQGEELE
jgi:hypothetical protein